MTGQASSRHLPDLLLHSGTVLTVNEGFDIAEAVSIGDGRILDIGSTTDILEQADSGTELVDLHGRTVIPGLIDSHLHLRQVGMDLNRVTLFEAREIADVLDAVEAAVETTPDGDWILGGWGWHESQLAEDRLPVRDELDRVAPDHPVFLPRGGHVAVLNSLALERAEISQETSDPDGGTIVRDPDTSRPNGVVYETARTELVEPVLPERGFEDLVSDVTRGMRELNTLGVTAAMEPGLERDELRAYMAVQTGGEASVRVDALVRVYEWSDLEAAAAYFARDFGNDQLKIGGVKYMIDGGVEGARLSEPYEVVEDVQEQDDYHGHFLLPEGGTEELREMFERAAELGHQVQTHAVGDDAIELVLDLYEAVDEEHTIADLRWTVMHLFLPTGEHLERMQRLGVLPTVQNHSTYLGRNMQKLWGQSRAEAAIPLRTIVDAGMPTGGGTDAPVVPWYPFESLWWMVTRRTVTAGKLGPEEAITREEALELWTRGSAYTMGWEDEIGSIEPGKRADLVVLDTDYLECEPDAIRDISVLRTYLGGEVVYDSGHEFGD